MGRPGAYLEIGREGHGVRPAREAVSDFDEYIVPLAREEQEQQASRCMYCGVAFCQSGIAFEGARRATGCPLHNLIPETNDLICHDRYDDAVGRLALTNPLPEFTGRVCPAPCETACNLGLHEAPVTIRDDERSISDYAWERGVDPLPAPAADAPLVSVVGSGPAGLASAWELARRGLRVQVIERDDRAGGLLMYGIPNMKLPKDIVARRIELMERSGIVFRCDTDAAAIAEELLEDSAAIVVTTGSRVPRGLKVPGAGLDGIYQALDYLTDETRSLLADKAPTLSASGKNVVIIGGGDTGVDCVATALRQGAKSVTQVIRAARPADDVDTFAVWPAPRNRYSASYGQQEAQAIFGEDPRVWSADTIGFVGEGAVAGVRLQDISYEGGRHDVEGTEHSIDAQLVLIAKGFTGPEEDVLEAFGIACASEGSPLPLTSQGTHRAVASGDTPVFVAGDVRTGSSLVASAIGDALACACEVASLLDDDRS